MDPPKPVYDQLFQLAKDRDYFVLTTNVDHCFQKAGFDKKRLFYTQGDYGLFQCSEPCCQETYDNAAQIRQMVLSQGFTIGEDGTLLLPEDGQLKRTVPTELLPVCPNCGKLMTMNLRSDDKFVEDEGWHVHAEYYSEFLRRHQNTRVLFLELGVGGNTPGIIKYPFWQMTYQWPNATYACLNFGEAIAPEEIRKKSICINADIGEILEKLS
jgi:NAD-dependent SIR2 family protein deacetylase